MQTMEWRRDERVRAMNGPGPWQDEPDKVQWQDPATGLACLANRNYAGAWCGYVGVPKGHPWFEKNYNDVDVEVHGGLTFSSGCDTSEDIPEGHGICHVVEPGEPEVWWLGFDCGHYQDLIPAYHCRVPPLTLFNADDVYRDLEYVKGQCTNLARQIQEAAS